MDFNVSLKLYFVPLIIHTCMFRHLCSPVGSHCLPMVSNLYHMSRPCTTASISWWLGSGGQSTIYTMNSDFQHRSSRQCHIKQDDFHSEFSVISSVQLWCSACRFCVSCRFTLSHKLYLSLLRVCWSIPFPLHLHTSANSRRFCHVTTQVRAIRHPDRICVMVPLFQHGI